MVWALPATMVRPYKQFEDHLNTIFIPCVLETPKTILYHLGSPDPVRNMHLVSAEAAEYSERPNNLSRRLIHP